MEMAFVCLLVCEVYNHEHHRPENSPLATLVLNDSLTGPRGESMSMDADLGS